MDWKTIRDRVVAMVNGNIICTPFLFIILHWLQHHVK